MKARLKSLFFVCLLACLLGSLSGCDQPSNKPITIAINPWPGYEYLYLAEQKGFFTQVGLNIKLVQLDSLGDAQRAYINGRVDGLTSTLIEVVQASYLGGKPLKVILVADYSNGGDVILGRKTLTSVTSLKGRRVGGEVSSLGIYVLQKALAQQGLDLKDVELVNVEQGMGLSMLNNNAIDAFVTYPPYSVNILKDDRYHTLFSSAEIPFEVVDTLTVSQDIVASHPGLVAKVHKAWQMALNFTVENEEEAYTIMSQREGISVDEFRAISNDLVILDATQQDELLASGKLVDSIASVCNTLVHIGSLEVECQALEQLVYRGDVK